MGNRPKWSHAEEAGEGQGAAVQAASSKLQGRAATAGWAAALLGLVFALVASAIGAPAQAFARYNDDPATVSDVTALQPNIATPVSLDGVDATVKWFSFTPSSSAYYEFYSEGSYDTFGALYEYADGEYTLTTSNDDGGDNNNFSIGLSLTQNVTYYLAASLYGSEETGTFNVCVSDSASMSLSRTSASVSDFYSNGKTRVKLSDLSLRLHRYASDDDDWVYLSLGTDYKFVGWYNENGTSYGTNQNAGPSAIGEYYVQLEGVGNYTGTKNVYFSIYSNNDISNWSSNSYYYYGKGEAVKFSTVKAELYRYVNEKKTTLVAGKDYKFVAWYAYNERTSEYTRYGTNANAGPSKAGSYYMSVQGMGSYTGTKSLYFYIRDARDLSVYSTHSPTFYGDGKTKVTYSQLKDGLVLYYYDNDDKRVTLSSGAYSFGGWYTRSYNETTDDYNYKSIGTNANSGPSANGTYYIKLKPAKGYTNERYASFYIESDSDDLNRSTKSSYAGTCSSATVDGTTAVKFSSLKTKVYYSYSSTGESAISYKNYVAPGNYKFDGWYTSAKKLYGKKANSGPKTGGNYFVKLTGTGDWKGSLYVAFTLKQTKLVTGGVTYAVSGKAASVTKVAKSKKSATIAKSVKIAGKTHKVSKIKSGVFKGTKVKKLTVKSTALSKAGVKGCLKGSKVTSVKVPKAKKKAYQNLFTKKVAGKAVSVK